MLPRSASIARRRLVAAVTAWSVVACVPAVTFASDAVAPRPVPAAARSRTIVDHAVEPAGGMHCHHCGPGACRVHGGHLAGCRGGMCDPHCPVRPSQYGYYHTQWRRWPGANVMPVSAEEAATPVAPPASQVPTADEESPQAATTPDGTAEDAAADADQQSPAAMREQPAQDDMLPTDPIPDEQPAADAPADASPAAESPATPAPSGDDQPLPGKESKDDGLFDQSSAPLPAPEAPVDATTMRYPAQVGRSLVAGTAPWRLRPAGTQRAAASARGR